MTIARAVISIRVSTTLNFTLSPTPRRLITASSTMNAIAIDRRVLPWLTSSRSVEPGQQVHRQQVGRGRGAGDAGADDRERHQERDEVHAERLVRVERGARGLRVLRDQLEVGERRQRGHHERHQERQPTRCRRPRRRHLPVTAYTPAPRMSPTMNSSSSLGPITRLSSGCGCDVFRACGSSGPPWSTGGAPAIVTGITPKRQQAAVGSAMPSRSSRKSRAAATLSRVGHCTSRPVPAPPAAADSRSRRRSPAR